tara:strand:- start:2 stop:937 length:936 start_codon:yes stop_codon:yes gene_type:complete
MNAKESVSVYCKAQADIIKIEKNVDEQKKALNERIKTCRSLLTDELSTQNISCIEVFGENESEPQYLRLKPVTGPMNITIEDVVHVLQHITNTILNESAEKCNHDFPKMITNAIQAYVREEKKKNTENKTSLSISSNRERGYTRDANQVVSEDTMSIAKDLISARKELSELKTKASEQKKEATSQQKEVEQTVKDALKATDPKNMTTRVHMMQGENEWVYYLRCKESEKNVHVGIRKIVPIVEKAVVNMLEQYGLSREYNSTFNLNTDFWKALSDKISHEFSQSSQETKTVSKLSLDRGAPRKRHKQNNIN